MYYSHAQSLAPFVREGYKLTQEPPCSIRGHHQIDTLGFLFNRKPRARFLTMSTP